MSSVTVAKSGCISTCKFVTDSVLQSQALHDKLKGMMLWGLHCISCVDVMEQKKRSHVYSSMCYYYVYMPPHTLE